MNSFAILLANSFTIGLPEIIIFLLASFLLGFSIHFYWSAHKSTPRLEDVMPQMDPTNISEEDEWRLQAYEQIEKHELTQERMQKELMRMTEAERSLLNELDETRDEVMRLEKLAEKRVVSEPGPPPSRMSDLVIAQQNLNEYLSKEMTERLEKAYQEFNFLQDRINKIQSEVIEPQNRHLEYEELEQAYFRITKEYDELKLRHLNQLEDSQRLTRHLADAEEKLRDASFQKQQLSKKVVFLEELANDLQQVSGHHKKLEGQLRRISEIESLLARTSAEGRKL